MIANKKERHKILRGAAEALRAVRGDFDAIEGIKVHFGCGCKICDLYLPPDDDGFHRSEYFSHPPVKCTRANG